VVRLIQDVVTVNNVGQVFIVVGPGQAEEVVAPIVGLTYDLNRSADGHTRPRLTVGKQTGNEERARETGKSNRARLSGYARLALVASNGSRVTKFV